MGLKRHFKRISRNHWLTPHADLSKRLENVLNAITPTLTSPFEEQNHSEPDTSGSLTTCVPTTYNSCSMKLPDDVRELFRRQGASGGKKRASNLATEERVASAPQA